MTDDGGGRVRDVAQIGFIVIGILMVDVWMDRARNPNEDLIVPSPFLHWGSGRVVRNGSGESISAPDGEGPGREPPRPGIADVLRPHLNGRWISLTNEQMEIEFPPERRETKVISCLKTAEETRDSPPRCSCTSRDLCLHLGHQTCQMNQNSYDYSKVSKYFQRSGEGDDRPLTSKLRETFKRMINSIGNRSLCIVGDSQTLQLAEAVQKEAQSQPEAYVVENLEKIEIDCKRKGSIPWWGCLNGLEPFTVRRKALSSEQTSNETGFTTKFIWFKHYTFEPWDFDIMEEHCDILFYNLARAHYANKKDMGRDMHVLKDDLTFALPYLARFSRLPGRVAIYHSSFPQHFPKKDGSYDKKLMEPFPKGVPPSYFCEKSDEISRHHENLVLCTLKRLQELQGSNKTLELPCTLEDISEYALNYSSINNRDLTYKIPLLHHMTKEELSVLDQKRWEVWKSAIERSQSNLKVDNGKSMDEKDNRGTVYYVPVAKIFEPRWDAHVSGNSKDCTHVCWNPLYFEPVFAMLASVVKWIDEI